MLRLSQTAVFVEVLQLLVENHLPLDQAVTLAAEAAGDSRLVESAEDFAAAVRRGEPGCAANLPGLPPLLRWLIAGGLRNDTLLPALRHAADDYRRRAQYQAELSRVMLPVFVTCVIARDRGRLACAMLAPYFHVLRSFAQGSTFRRVGRVKRVPPTGIHMVDWFTRPTLPSPVAPSNCQPPSAAGESAELSASLAALARSGLPLEGGLAALAEEVAQPRLAGVLRDLAARLTMGENLETAIVAQCPRLPAHLRG